MKYWKKLLPCIIHIDFLQFLEAKFNLNLRLVQLFIQFVLTITNNLFSLYISKQKFT